MVPAVKEANIWREITPEERKHYREWRASESVEERELCCSRWRQRDRDRRRKPNSHGHARQIIQVVQWQCVRGWRVGGQHCSVTSSWWCCLEPTCRLLTTLLLTSLTHHATWSHYFAEAISIPLFNCVAHMSVSYSVACTFCFIFCRMYILFHILWPKNRCKNQWRIEPMCAGLQVQDSIDNVCNDRLSERNCKLPSFVQGRWVVPSWPHCLKRSSHPPSSQSPPAEGGPLKEDTYPQHTEWVIHTIDRFHSIFSLWQLEGKGSCDVDIDQFNQQAAWWCNAPQFPW